MRLVRRLRRVLLIPRATRVARERQFQDLDRFLDDIRAERETRPPWTRHYADEVE